MTITAGETWAEQFAGKFDSLPQAERVEILHLLNKVLMWRGWAATVPGHPMTPGLINEIAAVFARNGCEIEVYT